MLCVLSSLYFPHAVRGWINACFDIIVIVIDCRAHFSMMKEVAIVGWDVAFTPQGIYLLEVSGGKRLAIVNLC